MRLLLVLILLAGCAGPASHVPGDTSESPEPPLGVQDQLGDDSHVAHHAGDSAVLDTDANATDGKGLDNHTAQDNATADNATNANPDGAHGSGDPGGSDPDGSGGDPDGSGGDPDGSGGDPDGSDPDGTDPESSAPGSGPNGTDDPGDSNGSDPETRLLEISIFDYTTSYFARPTGTEVEVTGVGTWNPDMSHSGSAGPHSMGHHVVDAFHEDGLVVFPDGREESRCTVDFRVTHDMQDESHAAITHIEIYNDQVWVYGMAIPGHADWESPFVCSR